MTEEQREDENSVGMLYTKGVIMFEKEAIRHAFEDTIGVECLIKPVENFTYEELSDEQQEKAYDFKKGAEFGYNKAIEDVKHDLMMKLKDEGIVKVLKDSIFCNKKLSSQEQQELCAWIECAMEFGENLDECVKELEEVNKANEWHYMKDGKPKDNEYVLIYTDIKNVYIARLVEYDYFITNKGGFVQMSAVIAWKEIVLPKESE